MSLGWKRDSLAIACSLYHSTAHALRSASQVTNYWCISIHLMSEPRSRGVCPRHRSIAHAGARSTMLSTGIARQRSRSRSRHAQSSNLTLLVLQCTSKRVSSSPSHLNRCTQTPRNALKPYRLRDTILLARPETSTRLWLQV